MANLATTFLSGFATQAARDRLLQAIIRKKGGGAAITAIPGRQPAQVRVLLRHTCQFSFTLYDPAQSRGRERPKAGNLIHPTTDSEKSIQHHRIQIRTKTSCVRWQIGVTPKPIDNPQERGAWELRSKASSCRAAAHPDLREAKLSTPEQTKKF